MEKMEKGLYGISFPFLVSAIAQETKSSVNREFIEKVFNEIKENSVQGYYCEVRWCENINEL